jgi:hypothetical protein
MTVRTPYIASIPPDPRAPQRAARPRLPWIRSLDSLI